MDVYTTKCSKAVPRCTFRHLSKRRYFVVVLLQFCLSRSPPRWLGDYREVEEATIKSSPQW